MQDILEMFKFLRNDPEVPDPQVLQEVRDLSERIVDYVIRNGTPGNVAKATSGTPDGKSLEVNVAHNVGTYELDILAQHPGADGVTQIGYHTRQLVPRMDGALDGLKHVEGLSQLQLFLGENVNDPFLSVGLDVGRSYHGPIMGKMLPTYRNMLQEVNMALGGK